MHAARGGDFCTGVHRHQLRRGPRRAGRQSQYVREAGRVAQWQVIVCDAHVTHGVAERGAVEIQVENQASVITAAPYSRAVKHAAQDLALRPGHPPEADVVHGAVETLRRVDAAAQAVLLRAQHPNPAQRYGLRLARLRPGDKQSVLVDGDAAVVGRRPGRGHVMPGVVCKVSGAGVACVIVVLARVLAWVAVPLEAAAHQQAARAENRELVVRRLVARVETRVHRGAQQRPVRAVVARPDPGLEGESVGGGLLQVTGRQERITCMQTPATHRAQVATLAATHGYQLRRLQKEGWELNGLPGNASLPLRRAPTGQRRAGRTVEDQHVPLGLSVLGSRSGGHGGHHAEEAEHRPAHGKSLWIAAWVCHTVSGSQGRAHAGVARRRSLVQRKRGRWHFSSDASRRLRLGSHNVRQRLVPCQQVRVLLQPLALREVGEVGDQGVAGGDRVTPDDARQHPREVLLVI